MSSQWRTVYKSANKEVRIKPRKQVRNRNHHHAPRKTDDGIMKVVVGLVTFFALLYCIAEFWPLVIVVLVIGRLCGRSKCKR